MTDKERRHIQRVKELPCMACLSVGLTTYGCDAHHLLRGGRRISHYHTIPLCPPHHGGQRNDAQIVSRHPWKRAFEARYGSEDSMIERTWEMLKVALEPVTT